jgi:hypothetical protein
MIKGDKIKLVAKMGVFDNIGEICEVIDVSDGGVITFKFGGGLHMGCMSYDEFQKYFELVEESKKREWSEWEFKDSGWIYKSPVTYKTFTFFYEYRHNGKKVQVRKHGIKAEATCAKEDEFNLETGLKLAECRLLIKCYAKDVELYAKSL